MRASPPREARAYDPAEARRALPVLGRRFDGKELAYLDSACTALKPEAVARALARFYTESGACGGRRSSHRLAQEVQAVADEARRAVASFLHAGSPNEIVFTASTTAAMNLLARAFRFEGGRDEVLVAGLSHNSALLPFVERSEERGFRVRLFDAPRGRLSAEELDRELGDRTALVVVSRASNVHGGVQPVAELARAAHRRGARIAVDAAQFVPTHREDVQASDVDFLAFSGHKLGAPFGVGVLYGKETALNALGPSDVGGGTVRSVAEAGGAVRPEYLDAPDRFEAGVQNVGGWAGLQAAIEHLEGLGLEAVEAHVGRLARRAAERLSGVPGLRVLGSPDELASGALVSAAPEGEGLSLQDLNLFLNHELPRHVVALRVGEHCAHVLHGRLGLRGTLRLSFGPHSTVEEADLAVDAIGEFARLGS